MHTKWRQLANVQSDQSGGPEEEVMAINGKIPRVRLSVLIATIIIIGFGSDSLWAGRLLSLGANTQAGGVNLNGTVAVGAISVVPGQARAFRWTEAGGAVDLGFSPTPGNFPFSSASGISDDGSVIVGFCSAGT